MKLRLLILSVALSLPLIVTAQGLDTAKIDEAMGRSGQKTGRLHSSLACFSCTSGPWVAQNRSPQVSKRR
jgi:hypothetical protein